MNLKSIFSISNIRVEGIKVGKKLRILWFDFYFSKKFLINDDKIDIISSPSKKDYLSVVAIAKNEGPYLKEWLEYHKLIGVQRFYFYDNESSDSTREILEPYIKDGSVVYHYVKGNSMQYLVYNDAINRYKNNTTWLGIIDLDEFIVPVQKDNLREFLKDYEKFSGVVSSWLWFDCNGHKTRPYDKLVIEAYTNASLFAGHGFKSIVKPKDVLFVTSPHYCIYKNFHYAVDENYKKIKRDYPYNEKYTLNKIRINHYYSKSEEEYYLKIKKPFADQINKRKHYEHHLKFNEEQKPFLDLTIQKFVLPLKKLLDSLSKQ